jgi:hypothetical protein
MTDRHPVRRIRPASRTRRAIAVATYSASRPMPWIIVDENA